MVFINNLEVALERAVIEEQRGIVGAGPEGLPDVGDGAEGADGAESANGAAASIGVGDDVMIVEDEDPGPTAESTAPAAPAEDGEEEAAEEDPVQTEDVD